MMRMLKIILILAFCLLPAFAHAQTGIISVDSVGGLFAPDTVNYKTNIEFYIRFQNNTSFNVAGFTNGFRVYSPDGAQWKPIELIETNAINSDMFDGKISINPFSVTGEGTDTVGYGAFRFFNTGMPIDFDDRVVIISTRVDSIYTGKTICIDSSYYPPVNDWEWSVNNFERSPEWGGPYCYTVRVAEVVSQDDADGDGVFDVVDNCISTPNPDQTDTDGDGVGDVCDNCPDVANADQIDADEDLYGAACDCDDTQESLNPETIWYQDADGDSYGDLNSTILQCTQPDSYVSNSDDCDDTDSLVHPQSIWYADIDGDGYGDSTASFTQCSQPTGFVLNNTDNCPTLSNPDQLDSDDDGVGDACTQTGIAENLAGSIPENFELFQNYPNPFNPTTTLLFGLAERSDYKLTIYNVIGQVVNQFVGHHSAGYVEIEWDASRFSSGIYFYRLTATNIVLTKKMLLLK